MAGFLYFGATKHPGTVHERGQAAGPGGAGGVVSARDNIPVSRLMYAPDGQTWRRIPGTDEWVGVLNDARPTPADLLRPDALEGHPVRLADGNEWIIPIARGFAEQPDQDGTIRLVWYHRVPQRLVLNDAGQWEPGPVVDRYAVLYAYAEQWASDRRLEMADIWAACCEALAVNYHLGPAECDLLGLFDTDSYRAVMGALIDMPTMLEWQKKRAGEGGASSSAGQAGLTEDTDQP